MATPLSASSENLEELRKTVTFSIEVIDPDTARMWLGLNIKNRVKKGGAIHKYERDMEKEMWRFTGQAIKFSCEGRVLDGQNRLYAVIAAGVTIVSAVVRGLHPRSQEHMDSGVVRGPSDTLALRGEKNPRLLASVAPLVYGGLGGASQTRLSHAEVYDVIEMEPSLVHIVSAIYPTLKL